MKTKKHLDCYVCIPLLCLCFAHIYIYYKAFYLKHHTPYKANIMQIKQNFFKQTDKNHKHFQNCTMFYLDMGTNIGVQIRKLYQPEHYPDAPVLPIFDKYFQAGPERRANPRLCAIGFELNPSHTQRLKTLETDYNKCGFKTKIYTETAVATHDGNTSFWTDNETSMMEWGASTVRQWPGQTPIQVNAINIGKFISENILPYAQTIVAKLDIEGEELNVLPNLLEHGVLCKFNFLFLETHERMMNPMDAQKFTEFYHQLHSKLKTQQCKVEISNLDDETYLRDEQNKLDSCIPSN
jgi:hypothetical protein